MTRQLLFGTALLLAVGCGDNADDEAVGDMFITTTTIGTPDPDGYALAVTGQPTFTMTATDTVVYAGLPIGDYTVALTDVEGGCAVTDGASRNIYQTVGTKFVNFQITCP